MDALLTGDNRESLDDDQEKHKESVDEHMDVDHHEMLKAETEPLQALDSLRPSTKNDKSLDGTYDSDYEEGDSQDFTSLRRSNRVLRYDRRNSIDVPLHERAENVKFINDFSDFMQSKNIAAANANNPTLSKAIRHLFHQEDSLLSFETNENGSFCLEKLRCFNSDEFIHLRYPLDWITSTAGRDGNKGQ